MAMNIEIGRYAGFCRGVKKAVDGAFGYAREAAGTIYTDGELIHNPQTLSLLARQGVQVLDERQPASSLRERTVIVRAHGVTPDRLRELKAVAGSVKNFTCKDVGVVQSIIKRHAAKGAAVVIFGKPDHPEVIGLRGYAKTSYTVKSEEEVENLPPLDKVLLVSQTTMDRKAFSAISDAVRRRFPDTVVHNTICDATEARQNEVREMARRSDCVLVIGAGHSSNTRRLHEIASELTTSHLVSTMDDLDSISFQGVRRLGITAGASTPDWLIHDVAEQVRRRCQSPLLGLGRMAANVALYSNLFVAIGAYLLALAVADAMAVPFSHRAAILVSLYYLSMALLNTYTNRSSIAIDNRERHRFMKRFRYLFSLIFLASLLGIVAIAIGMGLEILVLTLVSLALGIGYNLSYLPFMNRERRILLVRQRDLLALKSLVISFAVTLLLNGIFLLHHYPGALLHPSRAATTLTGLGFYFAISYVALLMFTRQALFEIKTAQTDRIAGVSSMLNVFSMRQITYLLFALPTILLAAMALGLFAGLFPLAKAKYFLAIVYNYLLTLLTRNRKFLGNHLAFELLVDSNLYIAGLVALL